MIQKDTTKSVSRMKDINPKRIYDPCINPTHNESNLDKIQNGNTVSDIQPIPIESNKQYKDWEQSVWHWAYPWWDQETEWKVGTEC